jgi:hypothetical protein
MCNIYKKVNYGFLKTVVRYFQVHSFQDTSQTGEGHPGRQAGLAWPISRL